MWIHTLFQLNGFYDLLCGFCLLRVIQIPVLQDLHVSMLLHPPTPVFQRFLAYWLLTNGIIRLSGHTVLIACSYVLEAMAFFVECHFQTVHETKAHFVIGSSLMLGWTSWMIRSKGTDGSL